MSLPSYSQLIWRASGTTSDPIQLYGTEVCGFFTPASFNSTAVTFSVCDSIDGTYVPLRDSTGSPVSFTVSPSGYCGLKNDQRVDFSGVTFLKIVGGSSEAANTVVKLAVRELN